jgi:hypothetical protein
LPAHAGQLQRIGELYMRLRYESAPAAPDMAALKSAVESLKVDRQGSGA